MFIMQMMPEVVPGEELPDQSYRGCICERHRGPELVRIITMMSSYSNPSKFRNSVAICAAPRSNKGALPRVPAYESGGKPCWLNVHPRRTLSCHCIDIALVASLDMPTGMPMNRRYSGSIRVFFVICHKCGSEAHWPSQSRRLYASASNGCFTNLIWSLYQSQHAFSATQRILTCMSRSVFINL